MNDIPKRDPSLSVEHNRIQVSNLRTYVELLEKKGARLTSHYYRMRMLMTEVLAKRMTLEEASEAFAKIPE